MHIHELSCTQNTHTHTHKTTYAYVCDKIVSALDIMCIVLLVCEGGEWVIISNW